MPGLYVHIPFCARRCPYCDFAVSTNARADFRGSYVAALQKELATALGETNLEFETVFFGGGTPTELPAATLNHILASVLPHAAPDAEISLEANPENLDLEFLKALRAGGWNRLSLGAQSFDEGELSVLGRRHDANRIENVVRDAKLAGFENISLDLIYGAPRTSLGSWRTTLRRAIELDVTHISAYSLTIEEGTAFDLAVARGDMGAPDDDFGGELMDEAAKLLGEAGFERYEVSNWARTGFRSRHNANYWRGGNYLGVGCGAHSHFDGHRFWNERDAKVYVKTIQNHGTARAGEEWLTPRERAVELVALGVRCRDGFSLEEVSQTGAFDAHAALKRQLSTLLASGALREECERIVPGAQGFAIADGLAARLVGQF
ncbi:MAG: radical SAM family heme chaperone HemW [Armatimonadetes bacterium]|nr:radical SAM family heme chaperone HemW [Armatimonadota bacterium]